MLSFLKLQPTRILKVQNSPRKTGRLSPFLDAKFPWSIWSSEGCEPFVRNGRCSCDKLQKSQTPFVVESFNGWPEPMNHWVWIVITWNQNRFFIMPKKIVIFVFCFTFFRSCLINRRFLWKFLSDCFDYQTLFTQLD